MAKKTKMSMRILRTKKGLPSESSELNCWASSLMLLGTREMIPAMIRSEIPLPIPPSVIFSPSHIKNRVPAVSTII